MAGALVIDFGKKKGMPEDEMKEGGDDMGMEAKKAAMQDMFAAAKSGDWDAAAKAFHDAYMACAGSEGKEEL